MKQILILITVLTIVAFKLGWVQKIKEYLKFDYDKEMARLNKISKDLDKSVALERKRAEVREKQQKIRTQKKKYRPKSDSGNVFDDIKRMM